MTRITKIKNIKTVLWKDAIFIRVYLLMLKNGINFKLMQFSTQ